MSVRALCLDLGHTTGYAHFDGSGERYGEVELRGDCLAAKLDHFARWLTWSLDGPFRASLIATEEPGPLPPTYPAIDRHLLEGLYAFTRVIAHRRDARFIARSPAQIKRHATGNGRAKKREVIRAVNAARSGRHITSDHVADAVALLDMTRETEGLGDDAFVLRAG